MNKVEASRSSAGAIKLTTALLAISVALDKMNREAVKNRVEKEAFEDRMERLWVDRLELDPNIAAALGTRSLRPQNGSVDGASLRERLTRLENPVAAASAA
jgi:hypothetical protein